MCKHKCIPHIVSLEKEGIREFNNTMEIFNKIKKDLIFDHSESKDFQAYECICGKPLMNANFINYKDKTFILGNKCIKDIFEREDKIYKKAFYKKCKICDKIIRKDGFKDHCETKSHLELKEIKDKYNICSDCGVYIEKDHKTQCKSCFMLKRFNKKQCSKCKKYNINGDTNYKICYKCKNQNKEEKL